jgi:hypothetical protein
VTNTYHISLFGASRENIEKELTDFKKNNTSTKIRKLNISIESVNNISVETASYIGDLILDEYISLESLILRNIPNLNFNNFLKMSSFFESSKTLNKVDLRWNRLDDNVCVRLLNTLQQGCPLQSLDLSGNRLTEGSSQSFYNLLSVTDTLRLLHLRDNKISGNGIKTLLRGIQTYNSVESFFVDGNPPLYPDDQTEIVEIMKDISSILKCRFSSDQMPDLKKILKRNRIQKNNTLSLDLSISLNAPSLDMNLIDSQISEFKKFSDHNHEFLNHKLEEYISSVVDSRTLEYKEIKIRDDERLRQNEALISKLEETISTNHREFRSLYSIITKQEEKIELLEEDAVKIKSKATKIHRENKGLKSIILSQNPDYTFPEVYVHIQEQQTPVENSPVATFREDECVVCNEKKKEYAVVPCGHLCYCASCSVKSIENCPICRTEVDFIMKIFY